MSHQQSSHEQQTDAELIAEVLEQNKPAAAEAGGEEPAAEEAVSIESLRQQLEQAQQQASANLDKALRTQAEMENLKKRVQKDLDDERKYGLAKFAKELLSVLDSLELGIQAASGDSRKWSSYAKAACSPSNNSNRYSPNSTSKPSTRWASRSTRNSTRPWSCNPAKPPNRIRY